MKRITVYDTEIQMKDRVQKDGYGLRSGDSIGVWARYVGKTTPFFSSREMHHWKVTLKCNQKEMEIDFYTGMLKHKVSALDVLEVLNMEAWAIESSDESYEDWCHEFGNDPYDPMSHYMFGLSYKSVKDLQKFLGPRVFQEFLDDPKLRGIEDD